jgi:hypothetical protein
MKESAIDCERAVVASDQVPKISEPGVGAFDDPSPPVAPRRSAILRCGPNAISDVRENQFDSALPQAFPQRIRVVGFVGDHPHRLLPRPARVITLCQADRREHRFREPGFRGGCRVSVAVQVDEPWVQPLPSISGACTGTVTSGSLQSHINA